VLALALGCLAVLVYTYLGYPLVIAALARLRPLRVPEDRGWRPRVSVCMAVYNGGRYLDRKLDSLLALDWPADKLEILVYSDGCTDDTEAVVTRRAASDPRIRLVRGAERLGKPTGLNRLREAATGEVLFITDVRQRLVPGALVALCEKLASPRVGCVSGNLVLEGALGSGAYWRYEKFIRRKEAGFRSLVGMTGSVAVLRKVDMAPLPRDLILDDVWIPMRLRLQGRLTLFAEQAQAFDEAFADEREFGRKVRTLAGNYQLFGWMPALLSPLANPSWFETVSHKVLRLVCPWVLLLLLVTSGIAAWQTDALAGLADERPLARLLAIGIVGGQLLFYLLAAVGKRAGRLGSLARTFVVMNVAALLGFWRYVTGGQRVTW
jgi:poly-beta-1,6-N-acetyl-D-glucosamine synthase